MHRSRFIAPFAILMVIATGAGFTIRLWRGHGRAAIELAGLPAIPDLHRWPPEFGDRLRKITAEAARADLRLSALGEMARLYVANGFPAEAETVLRMLRRQEPDNARWAWFLGVTLLQRGDSAGAGKQFQAVVRLHPAYAPAWRQLARFSATAGRHDLARNYFDRVLMLVPGDPEAMLALASIEQLRGEYALAIHRLEELLKMAPRSYEAHQQLAALLDLTSRKEEAALHRQLMEASVTTPEAHDPWTEEVFLSSYDSFRLATTGGLLLQDGHPDDSLPFLRKAANLTPQDSTVLVRLVANYLQLGQRNEARSVLEQGLARSPEDALLHISLADLLVGEGQGAAGVTLLQRGIAKAPGDADLRMALGVALVEQKNFAAAAEAFREAIRINPVLTEAQLNLGRCLLQTGRRIEGRSAILCAIEMRPDYIEALLLLIRLDLEDHDYDAANLLAEKLVLLAPTTREVLELYALTKLTVGSLLADAGRPVEAEQLYRAGLALNPNYGRLHGGLGMLLRKQERLTQALAEMQRYVELEPHDAIAYLLLGGVLESMHRTIEAREIYQQGLDLRPGMQETPPKGKQRIPP